MPLQRRPRSHVRRAPYQGGGRSSGNKVLESVGPAGRIRGNASHIYERYHFSVKERSSGSDRIRNETLLQYAEHYYRLMEIEQQEQSKKTSEDIPQERASTGLPLQASVPASNNRAPDHRAHPKTHPNNTIGQEGKNAGVQPSFPSTDTH